MDKIKNSIIRLTEEYTPPNDRQGILSGLQIWLRNYTQEISRVPPTFNEISFTQPRPISDHSNLAQFSQIPNLPIPLQIGFPNMNAEISQINNASGTLGVTIETMQRWLRDFQRYDPRFGYVKQFEITLGNRTTHVVFFKSE
ncbi:hypothetical protein HK103_002525 [Boothiomyces macroporosus]|uniref:Uncharacterized protein n=1 Tax=Boothiomyces macroporosus TaxID=261099 RepID=A0AAD5UIX4_9FUNG|nr:hypothetical protein HK103_002525 [Boothiomyces macroporosus]